MYPLDSGASQITLRGAGALARSLARAEPPGSASVVKRGRPREPASRLPESSGYLTERIGRGPRTCTGLLLVPGQAGRYLPLSPRKNIRLSKILTAAGARILKARRRQRATNWVDARESNPSGLLHRQPPQPLGQRQHNASQLRQHNASQLGAVYRIRTGVLAMATRNPASERRPPNLERAAILEIASPGWKPSALPLKLRSPIELHESGSGAESRTPIAALRRPRSAG